MTRFSIKVFIFVLFLYLKTWWLFAFKLFKVALNVVLWCDKSNGPLVEWSIKIEYKFAHTSGPLHLKVLN